MKAAMITHVNKHTQTLRYDVNVLKILDKEVLP